MSRSSLPPPERGLFPSTEERRKVEDFLTQELIAAAQRVTAGPVNPRIELDLFRRELGDFDFQSQRPLEELISWTVARLEQGIVQMTHPRYFGLFNPAPTFPSQCADRIAAAFNPQLASSASSPVPVEIEAHVIRSVASRVGMAPGAGGQFATGASEANFTSFICALTRAEPRFATEGVRAFDGPVTLYASEGSHVCWLKIAHQAGVGRAALRLIATDATGRMDPQQLRAAIATDRAAGCLPVLLAATAGTTVAGMIDPLEECAAIARTEGIWYHVDAAWGGAAVASERLRPALAGLELADSVTIDAHKWFATTMGCAMFIVRSELTESLSEAFHSSTTFMPSTVQNLDPYLNSVQWSRRFLGLRLFLSLGAVGWEGFARHVERSVAVVARIEDELLARGWTTANDSPLAVLCMIPPAGYPEPRSIASRVVASGRAWVAAPSFQGRDVVRICATSGESTLTDVAELVEVLHAVP